MDTPLLLSTMQKIDFPSNAENIHLVEKMIDNVCDELKVNEDHYGNILIALTEAVNNAIHHGNRLDPNKTTSVSCDFESNKLTFKVEDQGPGFDFTNLPDPTSPENIENPNGRGIFLMKNLADEIAFENEGRIVELTFNLN
jgi:serine/threonine-protein kinase RsbW